MVRQRIILYSVYAALSALVLITMICVFTPPQVTLPPAEIPSVTSMKTFSSYADLRNYILGKTGTGYHYYQGGPLDWKFFSGSSLWERAPPTPAPVPESPSQTGGTTPTYTEPYSTTNIQVAGVDETDIVKTDGKYLYTVSSKYVSTLYSAGYSGSLMQNAVFILKTDPRDSSIVGKIVLDNNTYPAGIFLSKDGSRLVIVASQYRPYSIEELRSEEKGMLYGNDVYTFVNVYDVSNKASPTLTRNFTVSGSYFNSRMIDDYAYIVVSQQANIVDNSVTLPAVIEGPKTSEIAPTSVYYADSAYYGSIQNNYFTFTTFFCINVVEDAQQATNMTVMMGGASTMYVSANNIYVTYPTYSEQGQYSAIYRVQIEKSKFSLESKGSVPGDVLNQYSMDEFDGHFRIATNWRIERQVTNVYVLNMSLSIVGKLEGLAEGENLHSVRFMGEKVYLVTFKKTDPLFVVDLSQPTSPVVLGALKIPGYSDYLHPYDDTHLIGIGKETVEAKEGDFAWYQGLKLSLFDVSDVNNPVQMAKYVIGDRGTDSLALSDPKAFLFDRSKNLLVIPVGLAIIDVPLEQRSPSTYGEMVWQGAYVFSLTLDGGFVPKGNVTHFDETMTILTREGEQITLPAEEAYWRVGNYWVCRALYVGNTLYTVSNEKVKLNSLTDLTQIAEVKLE